MKIRSAATLALLAIFPTLVMGESPAAMQQKLATFVSLTDAHITTVLRGLEVLALTETVRSGEWDMMKGEIAAVEAESVECTMWFAKPDGSYSTVERGLTDQSLKDRAYFPNLMAGENVAGPLVVSKSTGRKSVIVAVPVRQEGRIVGALGASVFLDSLSRKLREELALPAGMIFYALDTDGRTTLNHVPERVFLDPRDQGDPSMTDAANEMLRHREGRVEYEFDGAIRHVIYTTSPLTGWRCAVGVLSPIPSR